MKKKLLAVMMGSLVALSFGVACAQPYGGPDRIMEARRTPYHIQDRIDGQQAEIRKGMRAGVLTRGEAAILKDNLNHIKREFKHAKRDGYVSMEERERLDGLLHRNGRMIRRMENNGITRF
jgi:hypothetical protein